jgi:hypothetical protein
MSWSNLLGNQTVSRTNIQNAIDTGVLVQKNGVPGTETNREITKANSIDYVYAWELYSTLQSKASNQLVTKSNLAVQSMQFFGTNDGGNAYLYVGNNNRSWFYRIWTTNSYNQIASIASSIDGKYILIGRYGSDNASFFLSTTYGEVFNLRTDIIGLGDAVAGVAMSNSGQVMIATRQKGSSGGALPAKIYESNDYGSTWSLIYTSTNEVYVNGAAMSSDGSHWSVLMFDYTTGSYYIVKRDISTIRTVTLISSGGTLIENQSACLAMSKSGSYQLACPPKPTNILTLYVYTFYLSTDYGATWSTITVTSGTNPIQFTGCTVSASGQYMSVSATSPSGLGGYIYTSSDFGATWSLAVTYYTGSTGSYLSYVTSDTSGQFQYASYSGGLKFSQNYGQTPWNALSLPVGSNTAISVAQVTGTTPYIYGLLTGTNIPLYSKTTGVSGAPYNNVAGLSSGDNKWIAASGNNNNGKYVLVVTSNSSGFSYLKKSSDYGATFTTLTYYSSPSEFKCCSISDNGQYMVAVVYYSPTNTSTIISSTDGVSFNDIATQTGYGVSCDISGDGKYSTVLITSVVGGKTVYVLDSSDYSASFSLTHTYTSKIGADICMSNAGKYRNLITYDLSNVGANYYSSDYGVNFVVKFTSSYTFNYCACDNSGQVCIIGSNNASTAIGVLYYTTDGWATNNTYFPQNVYSEPELIGGVNVSNDGTYWTFVTKSPDGLSFVSTDAGATWSQTNLGYTYTFKQLSK